MIAGDRWPVIRKGLQAIVKNNLQLCFCKRINENYIAERFQKKKGEWHSWIKRK